MVVFKRKKQIVMATCKREKRELLQENKKQRMIALLLVAGTDVSIYETVPDVHFILDDYLNSSEVASV